MIKMLVFIFLIAGALILGYSLNDPGYVVLQWGNNVFESSAYGLILILIAVAIVWFILKKLFVRILQLKGFRQRRLRLKDQQKILAGIEAFLMKDWKTASEQFSSVKKTDGPMYSLKHMVLALTQDSLGEHEQSHEHLKQVNTERPSIASMAASLKLKQGLPDEALDIIRPAYQAARQNKLVVKALAESLLAAKHWQELVALLPEVEKLNVYRIDEFSDLEEKAYRAWLAQLMVNQSKSSVEQSWNKLPSKIRKRPHVASTWADTLVESGENESAEQIWLKLVKQHGIQNMGQLLINSKLTHTQSLMSYIRQSLKKDEDNPDLLRVLGHLAYKNEDFSLAQKALSKSIKVHAQAIDLTRLAETSAQQGQTTEAIAAYKQLANLQPMLQRI